MTGRESKAGFPGTATVEKTSQTPPLKIAAIATPGGGSIGMTLCPGKRQPNAVTGPWNRNLEADMEVIKNFRTNTLITLMETFELAEANVPKEAMNTAANKRRINWLHLPIADFGVPDSSFEETWGKDGNAIRRSLEDGGCVLVHCRGGRGRAGLMAARILVEMGVNPYTAIDTVRAANPLAIETIAQENHIKQCRRVAG